MLRATSARGGFPLQDLNEQPDGIFQSTGFWKACTLGALIAAIIPYIANLDFSADPNVTDYVAVVGDVDNPMWVVGVNTVDGTVSVRAENAQPATSGSHHLWVTSGEESLLLGELPTLGREARVEISPTALAVLEYSRTLTVTEESSAAPESPSNEVFRATATRI